MFLCIIVHPVAATHIIIYNYIYIYIYNIYIVHTSSSNSFSVCYTAQAYTTSWLSNVVTLYYYTHIYSYSCGFLWLSTCYGSSYR